MRKPIISASHMPPLRAPAKRRRDALAILAQELRRLYMQPDDEFIPCQIRKTAQQVEDACLRRKQAQTAYKHPKK